MAHGESDGADGGAGDALDAANQATEIAGTEVEEDVRGGDAALPWLLGSGWTRRTTMRYFWIGRRGEWWSVAVAMASGGDGDSRVARGRESGEGERGSREREAVEGGRGRLRGVARGSGRLPRRSRRWPASARVRPARSCFVRWHGKKTGEGGQVGWAAGGAGPGR